MANFLTAQQVEDLLKINRVTVYRMLHDGRLKGVKIGQQWRFPADQFDRLTSGENLQEEQISPSAEADLPLGCVQALQDLYAELGDIGTIMLDSKGGPLTKVSSPTSLCQQILACPEGRKACEQSWKAIIKDPRQQGWFTCHAGLNYLKAELFDQGKTIGYLLSGQYLFQPFNETDKPEIHNLSKKCRLDEALLVSTAHEVTVCDSGRRQEVENYPRKYAEALKHILEERANLVSRLKRIVAIGTLD